MRSAAVGGLRSWAVGHRQRCLSTILAADRAAVRRARVATIYGDKRSGEPSTSPLGGRLAPTYGA
jgi:hypothetical protein